MQLMAKQYSGFSSALTSVVALGAWEVWPVGVRGPEFAGPDLAQALRSWLHREARLCREHICLRNRINR